MKIQPVTASSTSKKVNALSCFTKVRSSQKLLLKERFLKAYLLDDKIILEYKTRGGYFTQAGFDINGICVIKDYFRNYDKETGRLWGYLFTRKTNSTFSFCK